MSPDLILRSLCLAVLLAALETLHGIARTVWLVHRVGKARALRLSIVSGSLIAFLACWWVVPTIGLRSTGALWALGLWLALFMAGFDLALGHWLLHRSWRRTLDDIDPRTGNGLSLGLLGLLAQPWLVMQFHHAG